MKEKSDQAAMTNKLRKRAEDESASLLAKVSSQKLNAEKLLQELQIYQIELEMQHEELRQSRAEVEENLARATEFFDFAPASYLTLTHNGIIHEINLAGASTLGIERSLLVGRHLGGFVVDESCLAFNLFLAKMFSSHIREFVDIEIITADKSPLFVHIEAIADSTGHKCRVIMTDITALKLTELALRRESVKNETLLRAASDSIYTLDIDGNVLQANDAFCRMLGYTRDEMLTMNVTQWNAQWSATEMRKKRVAIVESELGSIIQTNHRRRDGSIINVEINTASASIDGQLQILCITRDITERERVKELLLASEKELRYLAEAMPQIVWMTRADGWVTYLNHQWMEYTGLTPEESLGHSWNKAFHPDDQQRTWDIWQSALNNKGIYSHEGRIRKADGSYRWWLTRAMPALDEEGNISKWFGTCTDIDEIKRAEEALRMQSEITANAAEGIVLIKASDGTIHYVNQRFEMMYGYAANELIGRHISSINAITESSSGKVALEIKRTLKSHGTWNGELLNQKKDGTQFWVSSHVSKFLHPELGSLWISHQNDISERKRTQAELQLAKEQAEIASQAKSQFLARASHELRTPLSAILGYAQILALCSDDTTLGHERKVLNSMTEAGWHLLHLINDLLSLSAIEANKLEINMGNVALPPLIDECIDIIRPLAEQKGVGLNIIGNDGDDLTVFADSFRLKQILVNLLSNAVKYNHNHGQVTINCTQRASGLIRIAVTDTGLGLTTAEQEKLFQPFVRLEQHSANTEGAGLGLVVSQQLTQLMDGYIGIQSQPGQGSTFWVELNPAVKISKDKDGWIRRFSSATLQQTMQVLYIEDNPSHVALMERLFKGMQEIKLITAYTPFLGLELAFASRPNIIITDIHMPGMGGYELLKKLQADERTKYIPVVAVSAHASPSDIARGRAAGFHHYLSKPLHIAKLSNIINVLLQDEALRYGNDAGGGKHVSVITGAHLEKVQVASPDDFSNLAEMRVLLVEDYEAVRDAMASLLQIKNIKVTTAKNGKEAVDILTKQPNAFDAVLMDTLMPVMGGREATSIIRSQLHLTSLPIIGMSALMDRKNMELGTIAGMTEHISKPFDAQILFTTLAKYSRDGAHKDDLS